MAAPILDHMQAVSMAAGNEKDGFTDPVTGTPAAQALIIAELFHDYFRLAHRMIGRTRQMPHVEKWDELSGGEQDVWVDAVRALLNYQETALTTALGSFPI